MNNFPVVHSWRNQNTTELKLDKNKKAVIDL